MAPQSHPNKIMFTLLAVNLWQLSKWGKGKPVSSQINIKKYNGSAAARKLYLLLKQQPRINRQSADESHWFWTGCNWLKFHVTKTTATNDKWVKKIDCRALKDISCFLLYNWIIYISINLFKICSYIMNMCYFNRKINCF